MPLDISLALVGYRDLTVEAQGWVFWNQRSGKSYAATAGDPTAVKGLWRMNMVGGGGKLAATCHSPQALHTPHFIHAGNWIAIRLPSFCC